MDIEVTTAPIGGGFDYLPDAYQLTAEEQAEHDAWVDWEFAFSSKPLEDVPTPFKKSARQKNVPLSITLSDFTQFAFRMPREDNLGFENFSFKGRKHMKQIYDTPARRILLICARQVEKSTCLGNTMIAQSVLIPGFKTLYVSPTSTQTKTFSNDRIKEPIETSEVLRTFTNRMLSQNVFEKQFTNYSKITMRNAFLNADRTRGIPAIKLALDEFQDLLSDNVPVMEQCTSHAPAHLKQFFYTGTPKSLDNNIEYYRSGFAKDKPMSTQGEWVIPCDAHGGEAGRYWNVLGEKNIGLQGLICENCGKLINPQHEDAQWAWMTQSADAIFESYRIPQLMVPWKPWEEILLDYGRYPRDQFYNEVLGLSYDSGMRPLTKAQVQACCEESIHMHPEWLESYKAPNYDNHIWAGIDWGSGENSYTVLTLGTYINGKFTIIYVHRFTGTELEPPIQAELIETIITEFKVDIIGADYGGGFHMNDILTRKFGPLKLAKFQYMGRSKRKVEWEPKLRRYKVFRTEVMSDVFNALKRRQIALPKWAVFKEPYAGDLTNIYSEYNEQQRTLQYNHRPDRPDDTFHSILYCFLASMIRQPRTDIIAPNKEHENVGSVGSAWGGNVFQGLQQAEAKDGVVQGVTRDIGHLQAGSRPSLVIAAVQVRALSERAQSHVQVVVRLADSRL